jgi:catechol 2,3-dioxygenase-like lactoylglutathione lyase family enzyme
MPPLLERIDHIHVFVTDRAAAERWYLDVLGFRRIAELAFWAPDGGPLTLQDASGTVHLALFERPAQPCRSTIALAASAPEFIAWQTHLGQVLKRPVAAVDHQVSWSLYFADPDGNPYEITSHAHDALAALMRGRSA